jgi:ABC-type amino acid transport substrate-binding protein
MPDAPRRGVRLLVTSACLLFSLTGLQGATDTADFTTSPKGSDPIELHPQGVTLRVAVKQTEPFVFLDRKPPAGYSMELWQEVAREAGFTTTLVTASTVGEMIDDLVANRADVAVGALSITSEREARIDFSHGIYDSGLGLMVHSEPGGGRWLFRLLERSGLFYIFLVFLIVIFLIGNAIWYLQRHNNHAHFPQTYFKGVGEAMWWSASVLLTGCCEDKKVHGFTARMLAVIWFLTGIISVSFVTASLASSMTLSELTSQIHELGDLKGRDIATIEKSEAAAYLASKNIQPILCSDIGGAIESLKAGKVRAVFYDMPMLRYQAGHRKEEGLVVLPVTYLPHQYGFGLQAKSPYRKIINQAILTLEENGRMGELRRKWFGDDGTSR